MKYILLIGDGMADNPVPELGGRTPLEAADKPFIDALAVKSQLGSVMNSADLNKSIKDKIRLTLELDSRYFMIARCITLLHYYHEGSYGDIYGFKLNEIIDIANEYSIHCLENEKPDEYKNLLAEMEEMGIVCQSEGRYRLRKASFIDIIGENPEVLEQEIEQNNQEA